jgi:hypothetical protein
VQKNRAESLQVIAQAQADVGDVKAALATAETIPELRMIVNVYPWPYKQITLATLRARAGDYEGAKNAAQDIPNWADQGDNIFRIMARAKTEARDIKGALEAAAGMKNDSTKALAYVEIAQAQVRAGDRDGAARTFAKALETAEAVSEAPGGSDHPHIESFSFFRRGLLRTLACAQAEAGEEKAAQGWIAKLPLGTLKAWALVGLAEGIAKRKAAAGR